MSAPVSQHGSGTSTPVGAAVSLTSSASASMPSPLLPSSAEGAAAAQAPAAEPSGLDKDAIQIFDAEDFQRSFEAEDDELSHSSEDSLEMPGVKAGPSAKRHRESIVVSRHTLRSEMKLGGGGHKATTHTQHSKLASVPLPASTVSASTGLGPAPSLGHGHSFDAASSERRAPHPVALAMADALRVGIPVKQQRSRTDSRRSGSGTRVIRLASADLDSPASPLPLISAASTPLVHASYDLSAGATLRHHAHGSLGQIADVAAVATVTPAAATTTAHMRALSVDEVARSHTAEEEQLKIADARALLQSHIQMKAMRTAASATAATGADEATQQRRRNTSVTPEPMAAVAVAVAMATPGGGGATTVADEAIEAVYEEATLPGGHETGGWSDADDATTTDIGVADNNESAAAAAATAEQRIELGDGGEIADARRQRKAERRRKREQRKRGHMKKIDADFEAFISVGYSQWKRHYIRQHFDNDKIEQAYQLYLKEQNRTVIQIYLVLVLLSNVVLYPLYDVPQMPSTNTRLGALFVRALSNIFTLSFLLALWRGRFDGVEQRAMLAANVFIVAYCLTVSVLGGDPGSGIFIVLMFCCHLLSGLGHLLASLICWLVVISFTGVKLYAQTGGFVQWNVNWSDFLSSIAFVIVTALFLSLMGVFNELSARRQFIRKKRLAAEEAKSAKALGTLLPAEIASKLRRGQRVAIRTMYQQSSMGTYRSGVCVLFAQICDFNTLVSQLSAKKLVMVLNDIFRSWDERISQLKVFKVETINEIYMACTGLPHDGALTGSSDNDSASDKGGSGDLPAPTRLAIFANELVYNSEKVLNIEYDLDESNDNNNNVNNGSSTTPSSRGRHLREHQASLELDKKILSATFRKFKVVKRRLQVRIGMNIGDVVSGVIGEKLPRYRLFGDTVNTASRHESTCEPGRIQMSIEMYNNLMPELQVFCEKRTGVYMKGKGNMTTYYMNQLNWDATGLPVLPIADVTAMASLPSAVIDMHGGHGNEMPRALPVLASITSNEATDRHDSGTGTGSVPGSGDATPVSVLVTELPLTHELPTTAAQQSPVTEVPPIIEETLPTPVTSGAAVAMLPMSGSGGATAITSGSHSRSNSDSSTSSSSSRSGAIRSIAPQHALPPLPGAGSALHSRTGSRVSDEQRRNSGGSSARLQLDLPALTKALTIASHERRESFKAMKRLSQSSATSASASAATTASGSATGGGGAVTQVKPLPDGLQFISTAAASSSSGGGDAAAAASSVASLTPHKLEIAGRLHLHFQQQLQQSTTPDVGGSTLSFATSASSASSAVSGGGSVSGSGSALSLRSTPPSKPLPKAGGKQRATLKAVPLMSLKKRTVAHSTGVGAGSPRTSAAAATAQRQKGKQKAPPPVLRQRTAFGAWTPTLSRATSSDATAGAAASTAISYSPKVVAPVAAAATEAAVTEESDSRAVMDDPSMEFSFVDSDDNKTPAGRPSKKRKTGKTAGFMDLIGEIDSSDSESSSGSSSSAGRGSASGGRAAVAGKPADTAVPTPDEVARARGPSVRQLAKRWETMAAPGKEASDGSATAPASTAAAPTGKPRRGRGRGRGAVGRGRGRGQQNAVTSDSESVAPLSAVSSSTSSAADQAKSQEHIGGSRGRGGRGSRGRGRGKKPALPVPVTEVTIVTAPAAGSPASGVLRKRGATAV